MASLAGIAVLALPLALLARPLDNPSLEDMLARRRGLSGNRIIHKRKAVRELLRVLREGQGVAIVLDQDARRDGVFVPFFGRPASTTPTLALLALRTGAPVLPVFSHPLPDGSYRVVYEPDMEIVATEDRDADVERITAAGHSIGQRGTMQDGVIKFVYFDTEAHPGSVFEISNMAGDLAYIPQMIADAARDWDGSDPIRTMDPNATTGA